MWWIWFPYFASLILVVFVSNKLGEYVDAMDKKTRLSGAFLGGVLLAAVTSLPELVTSITAAIMGQPEMTLGNILGSNVFDIAIIGFLMILFCRRVAKKTISRGNVVICIATLVVSVLILLCTCFGWQIVIPGINVNILTLIILVLYFVALLFTREKTDKAECSSSAGAQNDEKITRNSDAGSTVAASSGAEKLTEGTQSQNKTLTLSLQAIIWRFVLLALVLVGVSVAMTFMVDKIAQMYDLQRGLAGALFLGIATSLPEIVSTYSLVKLGNFDAGYGNIIGSCLFNFGVIAISDICYFAGTVFLTDLSSIILSACLTAAATILLVFTLVRNSRAKFKNSLWVQILAGVLILASYVCFLVLSV